MQVDEVLKKLKAQANPKNVEGMARFGINPKNTLGVSIYVVRDLAKEIKKNTSIAKNSEKKHKLALDLWQSAIHEARILASFVDESDKVTEKQMERWVADFDSWDVCDQVCSNLFDKTSFAYKKAFEWSKRKPEFEKRAGFVLMAALSVHDKGASDEKFAKFFPVIKRESTDPRNFVKKAVNWALRQIGKRNKNLNKAAINTAYEIQKTDSKSAKWVAADALRELQDPKVQKRLSK